MGVVAAPSNERPRGIIPQPANLTNGAHLILEVKGQDTRQDRVKREYLEVGGQAVNHDGGFGRWTWDVSLFPSDVLDKIKRAKDL